MSDLPTKQVDHPAHNVPEATLAYHGEINSIPTGTSGDRASDAVNREDKSDSEKKDQSRYSTPQWREIDSNGVEHY